MHNLQQESFFAILFCYTIVNNEFLQPNFFSNLCIAKAHEETTTKSGIYQLKTTNKHVPTYPNKKVKTIDPKELTNISNPSARAKANRLVKSANNIPERDQQTMG